MVMSQIAHHVPPPAQGQIPHIMDGIARVGYPRLCKVSSGEPLCGYRTAQLTTALCAAVMSACILC
jgi:hypothetical protein